MSILIIAMEPLVMGPDFFTREELEIVSSAVVRAEELVDNYFKLSPTLWLKNRYDIKTAAGLAPHERVDGVFAQVLKYEGRGCGVSLGSSSFSLYHVCLQDPAILGLVSENSGIRLSPFLVYILVHELVHVVRFLRFEHRYENGSEAEVTFEEEKKVHDLTYKIVSRSGLSGVSEVIDFFGQWHDVPPGGGRFKNFE